MEKLNLTQQKSKEMNNNTK